MNLALKNKVVLVTGASKGIGRAIAEAFAAEGARLAINARPSQDLEEVVGSLQIKGVEALAAPADVTSQQAVQEMVKKIASRFGTIDVLVNNAGGIGSFAGFEELTDADWQILFDLNVFSVVRVTRAVLPYMRHHKHGSIINQAFTPLRPPAREENPQQPIGKTEVNSRGLSFDKGQPPAAAPCGFGVHFGPSRTLRWSVSPCWNRSRCVIKLRFLSAVELVAHALVIWNRWR